MDYTSLYNALLAEIEASRKSCITELEHVEQVFKIALNYWHKLKEQLKDFAFTNKEEEINFYKKVKPKFTTLMEYMILLNHALLLVPFENKESERDFWEGELQILNRFKEKNATFVDYYTCEKTHHDHQYFLPENYDLANFNVARPYDTGREFLTSHDHLVATYMAQKMYNDYVKKKLRALDNLEDPVFNERQTAK